MFLGCFLLHYIITPQLNICNFYDKNKTAQSVFIKGAVPNIG